jgi:hypothetical protein
MLVNFTGEMARKLIEASSRKETLMISKRDKRPAFL